MVIDVAMTETARLAHYVLPAASQFEKPEATFFNLEFPHNTFHLRHRLLEPLPGTLAEPEIWARLVRALGVVDDDELRPLRRAAAEGLDAYAEAFLTAVSANPGTGPGTAVRALRDPGADDCPTGWPGRRRCGGWRRRRRWRTRMRSGGPVTPTATRCSRRSWPVVRV